ncbi:hypothetical protein IL38_23745 [Actinopolyspora erythraea]|uniref:SCP1.201-like deaminase n=1 Tax=Actinopolyspora erythraea TaxID=414996 RepID=A0ABR4WY60_9ACTN|nr:DddA-like double-stranded DNA deaminase toxin [Actinopolyspora erythraea]KGI79326.1 hypothetical protein IL38_23745 [Actinopolyspora erythraea]
MPSDLEQLTEQLNLALANIHDSHEWLTTAHAHLDEAGSPTGYGLLLDSNNDDAQQALANANEAANGLVRTQQLLARTADAVTDYRHSLTGDTPPTSPGKEPSSPNVREEAGWSPPPHCLNSEGDRYPEEAEELVAELPKRLDHSTPPGQRGRTHGKARLEGTPLPLMQSGHDALSDEAEKLLRACGFTEGKQVDYLKAHVEVKAMALLGMSQAKHGEIAINNTPCGVEMSREKKSVCHKVLPQVAAYVGKPLTVYGSRQDNQPYAYTYGEPRS